MCRDMIGNEECKNEVNNIDDEQVNDEQVNQQD